MSENKNVIQLQKNILTAIDEYAKEKNISGPEVVEIFIINKMYKKDIQELVKKLTDFLYEKKEQEKILCQTCNNVLKKEEHGARK